MAAFYSLLCKAIKKQPAGRSGRLFWRSGRDSNPRAIARKLISSQPRYDHFDTAACLFSVVSDEKALIRLSGILLAFRVFRENFNRKNLEIARSCWDWAAIPPWGFRVSPVMTTSIPLHIIAAPVSQRMPFSMPSTGAFKKIPHFAPFVNAAVHASGKEPSVPVIWRPLP